MNELSTQILDQAAEFFSSARKNVIAGAILLHKIASEKLYQARYGSFSEYLESECNLKDAAASKLIQSVEHYIVQGGFSQEKLDDIDTEKLYLASKVEAPADTQLAMARTLTREELRDTLKEQKHPDCKHEHVKEIIIHICEDCGIRI